MDAKTDADDESMGFELGAADFITKPVNAPVLKARVATQLQIRASVNLLKEKTAALALSNFLPTHVRDAVEGAARLRQVLLNLLGNAVRFTCTRDGVAPRTMLFVEPCPLADGRAGVQFRVSDEGIGMSPQMLNKLFQPFSQADASTARQVDARFIAPDKRRKGIRDAMPLQPSEGYSIEPDCLLRSGRRCHGITAGALDHRTSVTYVTQIKVQ